LFEAGLVVKRVVENSCCSAPSFLLKVVVEIETARHSLLMIPLLRPPKLRGTAPWLLPFYLDAHRFHQRAILLGSPGEGHVVVDGKALIVHVCWPMPRKEKLLAFFEAV